MNTTTVNGWTWPSLDQECHKVIFDWLPDLNQAIKLCRKRRAAIQAGGCTGVWPKHLSRFFDVVHTFEPDSINYQCLVENCLEENIVKHNTALGDRRCKVDLFRDNTNIGAHFIKGPGDFPVETIDGLNLEACDLIQLDVEGFEFFAITGALQTIDKYRPVIMVEEKSLSLRYNLEGGATLNLLSNHGYGVIEQHHSDYIMIHSDEVQEQLGEHTHYRVATYNNGKS